VIWGADPLGPISTKICKVVGVHDVINHSEFGFNIFRGYRSTGGQNFRFPIDFAGHRYNIGLFISRGEEVKKEKKVANSDISACAETPTQTILSMQRVMEEMKKTVRGIK